MKVRPGVWQNNAIVVLSTPSLDGFDGIQYREPDLGSEVTGLATTDREGTERLKLLSL